MECSDVINEIFTIGINNYCYERISALTNKKPTPRIRSETAHGKTSILNIISSTRNTRI